MHISGGATKHGPNLICSPPTALQFQNFERQQSHCSLNRTARSFRDEIGAHSANCLDGDVVCPSCCVSMHWCPAWQRQIPQYPHSSKCGENQHSRAPPSKPQPVMPNTFVRCFCCIYVMCPKSTRVFTTHIVQISLRIEAHSIVHITHNNNYLCPTTNTKRCLTSPHHGIHVSNR
jgi:hypothetical protein